MIRETIYIGKDNSFDLTLLADGAAIDANLLTRMVVVMKSDSDTRTVDSDVDAAAFDKTVGGGVISFIFGNVMFTGQPFPADEWSAQLTVYDVSHPNGLLWDEEFMLDTVEPDA